MPVELCIVSQHSTINDKIIFIDIKSRNYSFTSVGLILSSKRPENNLPEL